MGTFTVAVSNLQRPPQYTSTTYYVNSVSCKGSYPPIDFESATLLAIELGLGAALPGRNLITTYSGAAYQTLNIISFEAGAVPAAPEPNVAKLYLDEVEVEDFPFPINIENLTVNDTFGLIIGTHSVPKCGAMGSGFSIKITFTITDINGLTGPVRNYNYIVINQFTDE